MPNVSEHGFKCMARGRRVNEYTLRGASDEMSEPSDELGVPDDIPAYRKNCKCPENDVKLVKGVKYDVGWRRNK